MAMERQANSLIAGIAPSTQPTVCPMCVADLQEAIREDQPGMLRMRRNGASHRFFITLMMFVTVERTFSDDERDALSRRLLLNHRRCRKCKPAAPVPPSLASRAFDVTYSAFCEILSRCVTTHRGQRHKVFANSNGLWPCTREQLFPHGLAQSIRMLALSLRCIPQGAPATLLTALLADYRPLVFPEIMKEDNRAMVLGAIIAAFDRRAQESEQLPSHAVAEFLDPGLHEQDLLWHLGAGPGSDPKDPDLVTRGFEAPLYRAIVRLLTRFEDSSSSDPAYWLQKLADVASSIWLRVPTADRANPPEFLYQRMVEFFPLLGDPYARLSRLLIYVWNKHSCFGPGCDMTVFDSPSARPFALCAKCKRVRYCSKECQKRDWRRDRFPHKELCDMLWEVFRFADLGMDAEEFADSCRTHDFPLERATRLGEWIRISICKSTSVPSLLSEDAAEGSPGV